EADLGRYVLARQHRTDRRFGGERHRELVGLRSQALRRLPPDGRPADPHRHRRAHPGDVRDDVLHAATAHDEEHAEGRSRGPDGLDAEDDALRLPLHL
ncbi:hypothetical protein OXX69_013821, partial [Metschnikowia pulcherrima]